MQFLFVCILFRLYEYVVDLLYFGVHFLSSLTSFALFIFLQHGLVLFFTSPLKQINHPIYNFLCLRISLLLIYVQIPAYLVYFSFSILVRLLLPLSNLIAIYWERRNDLKCETTNSMKPHPARQRHLQQHPYRSHWAHLTQEGATNENLYGGYYYCSKIICKRVSQIRVRVFTSVCVTKICVRVSTSVCAYRKSVCVIKMCVCVFTSVCVKYSLVNVCHQLVNSGGRPKFFTLKSLPLWIATLLPWQINKCVERCVEWGVAWNFLRHECRLSATVAIQPSHGTF